jgi:hypothetical protein
MTESIGRYPTLYEKFVPVKDIVALGYARKLLTEWTKAGKIAPWKTEVELDKDGKAFFTFYCPNHTRNIRIEDFLPDDECYDANEFLTFIEDSVRDELLIKHTKEYLFDVHGANNSNARQSLAFERDEQEVKLGQSELCLSEFIRRLETIGGMDRSIDDFCILLESGMRVFDELGQTVDAKKLTSRLQQADNQTFKHDSPETMCWEHWLDKELTYCIRRDEVARVYQGMKKADFPWRSLLREDVWLPTRENWVNHGLPAYSPPLGSMEDKDTKGFLYLNAAINRVLGRDDSADTDTDPKYKAIHREIIAERAKKTWPVRLHPRRDTARYEGRHSVTEMAFEYVHFGELAEWAFRKGFDVSEELPEKYGAELSEWLLKSMRLKAIEKERGEYRDAKFTTGEELIEKRRLLAELNQEKSEIKAWLNGKIEQAKSAPQASGEPVRENIQQRRNKLAALFEEIEQRAKKHGIEFDRAQTPGNKKVLRTFIKLWDKNLSFQLPADDDRLDGDIKPLGVKFLQGNHERKGIQFFKELFPEFY